MRTPFCLVPFCFCLLLSVAAAQPAVRSDHSVPSAPGIELFVREVAPKAGARRGPAPVLLLHGAYAPSIASFDLPVEGGSLAADLAAAGLRVFLMDVRGYGRSTRPPRMSQPPVPGAPMARASEALEDIDAVVEWIRRRTSAPGVALAGWGAGGHWAGQYATRHAAKTAALVLYNTPYGGGSGHASFGKGSDLDDPARPGTFNRRRYGAYHLLDAASLLKPWDAAVPIADKGAWRDPRVAAAYVQESLSSDATASTRRPPSLRAPSGALADAFDVGLGRQPWDAGLVQCRTLIIAGERDVWSRPEDRERLKAHLVNAPAVEMVVVPGATHFVHLDRAARGRTAFVDALRVFLLR